jgi:hypothetical protein
MKPDPSVVWAAAAICIAFIGLIAFIVWRLAAVGGHKGLVGVLIALGVAFAALPPVIIPFFLG